MGVVWACSAGWAWANQPDAQPTDFAPRVDAIVRPLVGEETDAAERASLAERLVSSREADAPAAVVWALQDIERPAAWLALARAVASVPLDPATARVTADDPAVARAMSDRVLSLAEAGAEPALRGALIDAVARLDLGATEARLAAALADPGGAPAVRVAAAQMLAGDVSRARLTALVGAAQAGNPPAVRDAAHVALVAATGLAFEPDAPGDWAAWLETMEPLSDSAFADTVRRLKSEQARAALAQARRQTNRHIDALRQVYRVTPADQRTALIARWINDPSEHQRRLGLDLARARLGDGLAFDEALREALRARVQDPLPELRAEAVLVLAELADEPAADAAAGRLASAAELDERVIAATLRLLTRTPRRAAVVPCVGLLTDATHRDAAATALVAAAEADLIGADLRLQAARTVRTQLRTEPLPGLVELLAVVGDAEDWARIEAWLTDEVPAMRVAAARQWLASGRSLAPMVPAAGDAVLQPVLYAAVAARGGGEVAAVEPALLRAMVEHRPGEALLDAWTGALGAALRDAAPTDALLALDAFELRHDEPGRAALLLDAAVDAAGERAIGAGDVEALASAAELRLRRAEVRTGLGAYEEALADLGELPEPKDERTADRVLVARVACLFGLLRVDDAVAAASPVWSSWPAGGRAERLAMPTVDAAVAAAMRLIDAGQSAEAERLIVAMKSGLGQRSLDRAIAERIGRAEAALAGGLSPAQPESTAGNDDGEINAQAGAASVNRGA